MAWIAAGASLIGGMMASGPAEDASNAQVASGREANAVTRETRDLIRADNAPWLARGNAAGARLADLMGLDVGSASQFGGAGTMTPAQIRAELIGQYTTGAGPGGWVGGGDDGGSQWIDQPGKVDEVGLNAAIQQRMQQMQTQNGPAPRSAQFGSLFKPFDASSVANDPGYQFALDEGTKATNNAANARGGLYSGSTLKALARFNQGNATKYFGDAFNRDQVTKGQQYNMLSGTANTGQAAVNQVSNANQNAGTQIANTTTDMGNARASGYVGGANAWQNAIGTGVNNFQQGNMIKALSNRSGGGSGSLFNGWSGSEPYNGYNASVGL